MLLDMHIATCRRHSVTLHTLLELCQHCHCHLRMLVYLFATHVIYIYMYVYVCKALKIFQFIRSAGKHLYIATNGSGICGIYLQNFLLLLMILSVFTPKWNILCIRNSKSSYTMNIYKLYAVKKMYCFEFSVICFKFSMNSKFYIFV